MKNLFYALCIGLGILTEAVILESNIGIGYLIFTGAFYMIFILMNRREPFYQKQFNGLLFVVIMMLSATFFLFNQTLFYIINFLLIPPLIIIHTVLLTNSDQVKWYSNSFLVFLIRKWIQFFHYFKVSMKFTGRRFKRGVTNHTFQTGKKILIGHLITLPLLYIILSLLSTADEKFAKLLALLPDLLVNLPFIQIWRISIIIFFTVLYFIYFKMVGKKINIDLTAPKKKEGSWDSIIMITVLLSLNFVYLLFIFVQFDYFFSSNLQEGLSYAQYARRGFFELLTVTVINYIILITTLSFMEKERERIVQFLLTLLIVCSSCLLVSSFARLSLYEHAYGFTFSRFLAHAAMIYLFVVFGYTLIKVWLSKLSLVRFTLLFSLLFYVGLNFFGIDQFIVEKNIERYHQTGKIDIEYFEKLSYSVFPQLVDFHNENPSISGLHELLLREKQRIEIYPKSWKNYNLSRKKAEDALENVK
jgi:hypothetical protein